MLERTAENKINQGILLKEFVNSMKFNIKSKTAQEWRDLAIPFLSRIVEKELKILEMKGGIN